MLSTKIGRLLQVRTPEERDGIGKFFDVPSRNEVYDYSYDGVMRSLEFSPGAAGRRPGRHPASPMTSTCSPRVRGLVDEQIDEFMAGGY